eukprot:408985_1
MSKYWISGGSYFGAQSIGDSQNNTYNLQEQTNTHEVRCKHQSAIGSVQCPSETNTETKVNKTNGKYQLNGGVFYGPMTIGDGNTVNNIHIHIGDADAITHTQTLHLDTDAILPSASTSKYTYQIKTIQSKKRARSITHENSDNKPKNKKQKLNEFTENVSKSNDNNDIIKDKKYDNINDIDGVAKNNESSINKNKQILTNFVPEKQKKIKKRQRYDLVKIKEAFHRIYGYDKDTKEDLCEKKNKNTKSVEFGFYDNKPFDVRAAVTYVNIRPMQEDVDYGELVRNNVNKTTIVRHWCTYIGLNQQAKKTLQKHKQYLKQILDENKKPKEFKCLRENCKHKKLTTMKQWKNHCRKHK